MSSRNDIKAVVVQQAAKAGALIRLLRKQRRLTQAQFAERLGITVPTARRLESGDTSISLNTFLAGLAELGIIDEVLRFSACQNHRPLPHINPGEKVSFAKGLQLHGFNSRDAENAAWLLSLTDQQRITLLQKQEREQKLCGIALR